MNALVRPLVLGLLLVGAARAAQPFPQAESDLPPDPAARFGTLPNGLRYVIMPNHEPKDRASLRLLVQAGSLNERGDQRGLAHFLEHLAFNGSSHYPPGTLVEFFQRMGMSFGGDTNANTGFDRTVYLLELPDTKAATLAEGLQVFGDYAGGLLLSPAAIDKERGIILSEKRARDSVDFRTFVAQFKFLLGGTLLPERMPIGETAVIETAQQPLFLDLYNTWYRPELMSVVVVGDVDPGAVEKQIAAALAKIADRAPERPAPDRGAVTPHAGLRTFYHHEAEAPGTTVSISLVTPYQHERDTAANRLKYLPRFLATEMVNRRLSVLAKRENAPFYHGRTGVQEAFDLFREASIDLTCKADQWSTALPVAEQELRRALQHGFQPAELQEVVSNYRNALEQAVKTAPTRRSGELADTIVETLNDREVFTSPETDLKITRPALDKITVDECAAALRQAWAGGTRNVLVSGNAVVHPAASPAPAPLGAKTTTPAEDAIAAVYEESLAVPVASPAAEANLQWSYTDFGPPGRVIRREHVADLNLDLITFANGVRLNIKKTPFEADLIRLNARVGSGLLTEPKTQRGLAALAEATFDAGGLGRHSADDLRRILAGRNVGVQFGTASDAFVFSSSATPADLLLDLQLLAAKITDPGYRPEALRQVRKGIDQLYLSFEHTPNGPLSMEIANLLASGDPRFGLPPKAELLSRTLDEVRAWLTPELAQGPIELAAVGDLDVEATIAAVGRTLGALPPRSVKPSLEARRRVAFPAQPFAREYQIASEIPKGLVTAYWPTTDESDIHRARRLNVLGEILGDRLRVRIREQLGGTYSPNAGSFTSDTFPGYGYLSASVDVEPAMAAKIMQAVIEQADELARQGPSADELVRAKEPLLTQLRESVRTNGYWLGAVLARAQEKPEVLEWARSRQHDVEAISVADEAALAKEYLAASRVSHAIIVPAPPAKPAAPAADASTQPASPKPGADSSTPLLEDGGAK
jgi:zinc protease